MFKWNRASALRGVVSAGRRWGSHAVVLAVLVVSMLITSQSNTSAALAASGSAPVGLETTTWVVTSAADHGPGTLREALERAPSGATLTFDPAIFPLASPTTILVTNGPLPPLVQGDLTIDASRAGVILDGSELRDGVGLLIQSNGNVIKGLQIVSFPTEGIAVQQASHNTIGGVNATPGGACTGDCNLLSGNGFGLGISGERSSANVVSGNYIGTDLSGTVARGNRFHGAALVLGAQQNTIGGDTLGERNLISGNGEDGVHIWEPGTTGNTVSGNYIGTDVSGTAVIPNANCGVNVGHGVQDNRIGGATAAERNVISGNGGAGVCITGRGTVGNVVSGNYIGVDVVGTAALGNTGPGITVDNGAVHNLIGGETTGQRNVVIGGTSDGVSIAGAGTMYNTVRGNWIGLDLDGARQAFPADMTISPNFASDCTLYVATRSTGVHKTTDCGASWAEVNSGLTESWIRQVEIPPDARDADTVFALAENGHLFVTADGGAHWNLVSTALEGRDCHNLALSARYSRNQIIYASVEEKGSEDPSDGPGVFTSTDGGVTWTRTAHGMADDHVRKVVAASDPDAADTLFALTWSGIEASINGGADWQAIAAPDTELSDLALSPSYASDGTIFVTSSAGRVYASTDGGVSWSDVAGLRSQPGFLAVSPNYAEDATVCYGNLGDEGVNPIACSRNGGATWSEVHTGLPGHCEMWGTTIIFSPNYRSDSTLFVISVVGMARTPDGGRTWRLLGGLRHLGNLNGVALHSGASYNTIGPDNVISNNHAGVTIAGAEVTDNLIRGNLIGTDPTGTFAQGNSGEGVGIQAGRYNQIGGDTAADRNVISGNGGTGIWLGSSDTMSNTIRGNYIGTDITGTAAVGNAGEAGIVVIQGAQHNVIGGDSEDAGNVISGNHHHGVSIADNGTSHTVLRNNEVGTAAGGLEPLGNAGHGVSVGAGARFNTIGPGNAIAFNAGMGVAIAGITTTGNRITANRIHHNGGSGIHTSGGGNAVLSPPVVTYVGSRIIQGTAAPSATVEIFSDAEDEGQVVEGSTIADGEGRFTFRTPAGRFSQPNVTATTTDVRNNTSQFSQAAAVPAPAVTRELPYIVAPAQVSVEPKVVGTNLGLALFSVLFFGLTSTVFNSILEEHRDDMLGAFRRLIPRRFADGLGRLVRPLLGTIKRRRGRALFVWLAVLLVTSVIESFLDPELRLLSLERLGILVTLFASAIVVSGLELGTDLYAHRRLVPAAQAESKIQWIGLLIAVVCVVFSRVLDFKPGYLYGIVGAVYLAPAPPTRASSGKRAVLVLLTVFVGGLIVWLATLFLPAFLAELEPIFLTIFLISLQGVFFQLFPLNVTDGGDIWTWRRSVWFVLFSIVFFCFYHFLLNPNASDVQALQQNGVQAVLILIVVSGLATLALWLLLPFRLRPRRAKEG